MMAGSRVATWVNSTAHSYILVDRVKDMVIRGGENIACPEVEGAIYEHSQVLEACVFGIPDERLGEVLCAAIY